MKKQPAGAPLWGLAIAVLATTVATIVQVQAMAGKVVAALSHPQALSGELALLLSGGVLLRSLVVWVVLIVLFRKRWNPNHAYGQFFILFVVTVLVSIANVTVLMDKARQQQAAMAAHELQISAAAAANFADPRDAEFVTRVLEHMRIWAAPLEELRNLEISDDPKGEWRALCGQVAFTPGKLAGFVYRRMPGASLVVAVEQDGLTAEGRAVCRPLVEKYVGVDNVDVAAATAAFKQAGCANLDIYYWEAEKTYCHAKMTRP